MAQQTAVQYLLEKLYTEYRFEFSGTIVDKAKQIEMEQITEAFKNARLPVVFGSWEAEDYYDTTYNKQI